MKKDIYAKMKKYVEDESGINFDELFSREKEINNLPPKIKEMMKLIYRTGFISGLKSEPYIRQHLEMMSTDEKLHEFIKELK